MADMLQKYDLALHKKIKMHIVQLGNEVFRTCNLFFKN